MTSARYLPSPVLHLHGSVVFILACVAVGEVTGGLRTALQYLNIGRTQSASSVRSNLNVL